MAKTKKKRTYDVNTPVITHGIPCRTNWTALKDARQDVASGLAGHNTYHDDGESAEAPVAQAHIQ